MARRFLAPKGRSGDGRGYLNQPMRPLSPDSPETVERIAEARAMCDEPEALSAEEHRLHIDKRARELAEQQRKFETAQRERERRLMTFDQRLAKAQHEAKKRRIDVTSDIRLLRHMQRSGKQVRHLEQRLFAIERRVWR